MADPVDSSSNVSWKAVEGPLRIPPGRLVADGSDFSGWFEETPSITVFLTVGSLSDRLVSLALDDVGLDALDFDLLYSDFSDARS